MTDLDKMSDRELDCAVAERVLGLKLAGKEPCGFYDGEWSVFRRNGPMRDSPEDYVYLVEYAHDEGSSHLERVPDLSTTGDGMLRVLQAVEKLPIAYPFSIEADRYGGVYSRGKWVVAIGCYAGGASSDDVTAMDFWSDPPKGVAAHESLPRAVALAALKALGSP